jgi:transposase
VQYTLELQTDPDGSQRETETVTVTRVTYRQNWSAYNAAQTEEKTRFVALLADLCRGVPQPEQAMGRPRLPMADMAFAAVYKVYSGFSSRRFTSDLRDAHRDGYIDCAPHFNSVSNYLASPELTPVLNNLITASSLPMRSVETNFAVDSSGFATSRFVRWYNKKWGREIDNQEWVKVHLICGVQTKIVTSVEVSGWAANDSPFFIPLLNATAQNFNVAEVYADKAYIGRNNVAAVTRVGATPFIPFKSNALVPNEFSPWAKMYHQFAYHRDDFLAHYHRRSNVETVFSMMKAKFGDGLRSKTDVAMFNEVLCKVLAHNLCVTIQAIHELGLDPASCAGSSVAQKVLS